MENLTIIRKESHATQQEVADYLVFLVKHTATMNPASVNRTMKRS